MDKKEEINNEEEKHNNEEEEENEEDEEEKEVDKEEKKEEKNLNEGEINTLKVNEKEKSNEESEKNNEIIKKENTTTENNEKIEQKSPSENKEEIKTEIDQNNNINNNEKMISDDNNKIIVEEKNGEKEKKEEKKEKEESIINKENEKKETEEEEEEKGEEQKESTSTYILKYTRRSDEPRESAYDRELIKSKHCLFMIEFKILKKKKEKFLLIYCHEIAAIYFDEIYEKKYSIKDLYKENRHFRIFDDIEDAKNIIDEILKHNTKDQKKIFIDLQDNLFRLHVKITFFDKENEVIFNIPKKKITDKERIRLLPEFLKEIQIKMNHLEEENKKLKIETKNISEIEFMGSGTKLDNNGDADLFDSNKNSSPNIKKVKSGSGKSFKKK